MVIMYGKINTYGQRGCRYGEALDSITAMHKYEKVGQPHNLCERIYDLPNKLSSGGTGNVQDSNCYLKSNSEQTQHVVTHVLLILSQYFVSIFVCFSSLV